MLSDLAEELDASIATRERERRMDEITFRWGDNVDIQNNPDGSVTIRTKENTETEPEAQSERTDETGRPLRQIDLGNHD
jgi:glycyl-tRNA synthetase (class II)